MKIRTVFIPLLAVALIGTYGYLLLTPTSLETRPDISLMTIDGEELQLASLQGQPLLVTFWATTCPGCVREIPHLIELYEELAPRGLEIIAVAMDYDPPNRVLAMRKARNRKCTMPRADFIGQIMRSGLTVHSCAHCQNNLINTARF